MVSKEDILENPREYTSDEIIDAINAGVITLQELKDSGKLGQRMQKTLESKLGMESTSTSSMDSPTLSNTDWVVEKCHRDVERSSIFSKLSGAFSGDIGKGEWLLSLIVFNIVSFILAGMATSPHVSQGVGGIFVLLFIAAVLVMICQNTRRCHDAGHSGWIQLIPLSYFYLMFAEGEEENNNGVVSRFLSFSGRLDRSGYVSNLFLSCILCIFLCCLGLLTDILSMQMEHEPSLSFTKFWSCCSIGIFSAQACKRSHDLGRSGWWQLVPFYGIALLFWPGDSGSNEYGENPKE